MGPSIHDQSSKPVIFLNLDLSWDSHVKVDDRTLTRYSSMAPDAGGIWGMEPIN